jgi:hypothetical protein
LARVQSVFVSGGHAPKLTRWAAKVSSSHGPRTPHPFMAGLAPVTCLVRWFSVSAILATWMVDPTAYPEGESPMKKYTLEAVTVARSAMKRTLI